MSNFIAKKKREHEIAAEKFIARKSYTKAFFHVTKAAEFTLKLSEQCGGKIGLAYANDAENLLDIAAEIKEVMEKEPKPKKTLTTNIIQEVKTKEDNNQESRWLVKERPTERLADVAGMEEVRQELQDKLILPLLHPELWDQYKLKGGGGLLMYGPPGTGKTFLARAVAGELDMTFFHVTGARIKSKYVGESEQNIEALFKEAGKYPRSIIFIDECDTILSRRGNQKVNTVNQFLAMMDGFEKNENLLMVLAATNHPEILDSAVIRPGRLGSRIYIGPPDIEARKAIIIGNMKDVPMDENLPIDELAKKTEGYSGADIKKFCDQMKLSALKRGIIQKNETFSAHNFTGPFTEKVNTEDADNALDKSKPSITQKDIDRLKQWNDEQQAG